MDLPGEASAAAILASQNDDGGWGYQRGPSWTEPTAYALLALKTVDAPGAQIRAAEAWLVQRQRKDGGWAPHPAVDQSTWVTALAVLALADGGSKGLLQPAVAWMLRQEGRESGTLHRLRLWLLGQRSDVDTSQEGWPWYPETAGWVAPTALTILALERVIRAGVIAEAEKRVSSGRRFLMARRCVDGGWNHGSSRALGYEAGSYPESTGLALLALRGMAAATLAHSFDRAERHLSDCRSTEGQSWLRMALAAHSRPIPEPVMGPARCHITLDFCMSLLAVAAEKGRNPLIE